MYTKHHPPPLSCYLIRLWWITSQSWSKNMISMLFTVNTLRPRQNGRRFADDVFKCVFLSENVWILITISLKFVPRGPINNIPSLVQVMAWRRLGDNPLSETMMVKSSTHICVTRPQWVNNCLPILWNNWSMRHVTEADWVDIMKTLAF